MATAKEKEIAEWMHEEYKKHDRLVQHTAAALIHAMFGEEHLYRDNKGNWAINQPILDEFRRLTDDGTVVWSRSAQLWRKRRPNDREVNGSIY
jgi:hypothetical protein